MRHSGPSSSSAFPVACWHTQTQSDDKVTTPLAFTFFPAWLIHFIFRLPFLLGMAPSSSGFPLQTSDALHDIPLSSGDEKHQHKTAHALPRSSPCTTSLHLAHCGERASFEMRDSCNKCIIESTRTATALAPSV